MSVAPRAAGSVKRRGMTSGYRASIVTASHERTAPVLSREAVVTERPLVIASTGGERSAGRRGWIAFCRRSRPTCRLSSLPTAGAVARAFQRLPELRVALSTSKGAAR